ncbi:hypothetical protein BH20ACI1_BH20ACI1_10960 [soil metagenome]
MKKKILVLICCSIFILVFSNNSLADEPAWLQMLKKIVPLQDTRISVRKLLGKPVIIDEYTDYFDFKGGRYEINYSGERCLQVLGLGRWNVEEGTVIEAAFYLYEDVKFSSFKFNLEGFKKEPPGDTPQATEFVNKKKGIFYRREGKYLDYMMVFPAESNNNLICKSNN